MAPSSRSISSHFCDLREWFSIKPIWQKMRGNPRNFLQLCLTSPTFNFFLSRSSARQTDLFQSIANESNTQIQIHDDKVPKCLINYINFPFPSFPLAPSSPLSPALHCKARLLILTYIHFARMLSHLPLKAPGRAVTRWLIIAICCIRASSTLLLSMLMPWLMHNSRDFNLFMNIQMLGRCRAFVSNFSDNTWNRDVQLSGAFKKRQVTLPETFSSFSTACKGRAAANSCDVIYVRFPLSWGNLCLSTPQTKGLAAVAYEALRNY